MSRLPVAVMGATGTVGQKFIRLLADHPWFQVTVVTASPQSAGKRYADAAHWREPVPIPDSVADLVVLPSDQPVDVAIAFSALDAMAAGPIEPAWAKAGAVVVTNASPYRMDPTVPLLVPEVNPEHLGLLGVQRQAKGWPGAIVANPNCSTAGLVLALAPLHRAFGVNRLVVSTMQAVSGAGWPGVPSLDILGNLIPHINGEEEKLEREPRKILGHLVGDQVRDAEIVASAHCNRIAVQDGHTETVSVGLERQATVAEAKAAIEAWRPAPQVAGLPSTPARPLELDDRPDRPQPLLDRDRGAGMTATIGRLRPCPVLDLRFVVLSHNTIRGAAGAAIQNAELLVAAGEVRQ